MATEWQVMGFAGAIDFQEGPGIMAVDFREEGTPLVRLAGLTTGAGLLAGCNYLDPDMVAARWAHFALAGGDVLLSTSASLGRIAIVPASADGAIAYTGLIRMRPRSPELSAQYIPYILMSQHFQRQVEQAGVGSVIRHFGPSHLRGMSVLVPPLPEQRAIAHVLGAIDDKIDLNRRMAATLEEMARALFTSWFVRFDPVRAKMAGQPTGLPAHIDALFPDALVDSELGEVPAGWGVCQVRDIADLAGGGTPATSNPLYWDPGIHHWATPKDLAILATPVLLSTGRRISDAGLASISSGLLPVGTILMSSRAPIGYVAVTHVPTAVNQGFIAMLPRAEHFAMFLKHWVIASQELIVSHANGSTFLEISKASFRPLPVISPPPVLLVRFQLAAGDLHARVAAATAEITTLTALRDTLLPKLVSGEVRITDAEAFLRRAGLDTAA